MTEHKAWLAGSAAAALAVFALMWIGFASQWNWLITTDLSSLRALHGYGVDHPGWLRAWDAFCTIFGPTAFRLLGLAGIVAALVRRNLRVAMFLLVSVELSGLLTEIAKGLANRPRPETAFVLAPSTSFPSGHALGVMVGVLAVLTIARPVLGRRAYLWLAAVGAAIVVAVGFGRVVLNVHNPSDVLAGWALGYAYFIACLLILPPWRPVREADETPVARGIAP